MFITGPFIAVPKCQLPKCLQHASPFVLGVHLIKV